MPETLYIEIVEKFIIDLKNNLGLIIIQLII